MGVVLTGVSTYRLVWVLYTSAHRESRHFIFETISLSPCFCLFYITIMLKVFIDLTIILMAFIFNYELYNKINKYFLLTYFNVVLREIYRPAKPVLYYTS